MWHNAGAASAQDWISITASGHNSGQQQRHEPHQRLGNIFESVHFVSPLLSDPENIGDDDRIISGTCPDRTISHLTDQAKDAGQVIGYDVLRQYSLMTCFATM